MGIDHDRELNEETLTQLVVEMRFESQRANRPWTPDEDLLLAARIGEGIRFSKIAAELNRTKGACVGHANRLGIVHPNQLKSRKFDTMQIPEFPPEPPRKTPIDEIAPGAQFKPLDELNPHAECHYPHGDSPFLFCAAPRERGSYCKFHYKLTHTPLRK